MSAEISVILPTYNRAGFLERAITSVLEQSVPVREIVIVDDGSTDGTEAVISSLGGPIRYIRQANQGPAAARNAGIQAACSEWIALLDSDDVWMKDKLEQQLGALESGPSVGLVHAAAALINENGEPRGEIWGRPEYAGDVHSRLLVSNGVNASSVLMKRAKVLEVGGYDTSFRALENWDLWLRLSRLCRFAYVDAPLIEYRVHPGNLIKELELVRASYAALLAKHLKQSSPPPPANVKRAAYARFHQSLADALVSSKSYGKAEQEFIKSLRFRPIQPDVWWRLSRVLMADGRRRLSR